MSEHVWAIAAVAHVDDATAAAVVAMDLPTRLEHLDELVADPKALRGPICELCRLDYRAWVRVVRPDRPWPCPGARPDSLGGPLLPPDHVPKRSESRQQRREAQRLTGPVKPREDRVKRQVETAIRRGVSKRAEAKRDQEDAVAAMASLGEALGEAADTDDFWA